MPIPNIGSVDDQKVGLILRVARLRRDQRQSDVSARAGISASAVARHERGELAHVSHAALRQHAHALGVRVELELRGSASDLLRDEEHATVVSHLKTALESLHWEVAVEFSYSEFGERGRVDLFAFHPARRTLLIAEIKTGIFDAQDMLGSLDIKHRLGPVLARRRGWRPSHIGILLAITRTTANERKVHRLAPLFSGFDVRGPQARAWFADPASGARLLVFVAPAEAGRAVWRNSRQRVRARGRLDDRVRPTARPGAARR